MGGFGDVGEGLNDLRAVRLVVLGWGMGLYIASPELLANPLVILAIALTPLLIAYVRTRFSAQFLLSNMLGVLLLCYTPLLASVVGKLVTPWLLWRVLWLLPVSLVIGFFLGEKIIIVLSHQFFPGIPQKLFTGFVELDKAQILGIFNKNHIRYIFNNCV